jgi:GT2 family glycosyltransferase
MRGQVDLGIRKALDHPAEYDRSSQDSAPLNGAPIMHLDLSSAPQVIWATAGETLVVFWLKDWPVGQVYVPGVGVGAEVTALARNAVDGEVLARAEAGLHREARGQVVSALRASVVICSKDRSAHLRRCLSSLTKQSRLPDEIIVVDNASSDDCTRQVAAKADVRYLREDRRGLDIARNTGALAAIGDIITFTDDDVTLHPRWLERIVCAFDDAAVMAVTGLVLPAELDTEAQQYFERHWGFGRGYRRIDFAEQFFAVDRTHGCPVWEIGAGASMGFRREVFERIGLFDERLDAGAAGCAGDSEFWHRVLAAGWCCRYEPSAVCYHYHRRDDADLARQIFAYMRGHAAALMVQFERTRNWGNLRRVIVQTPAWYIRRLARRTVKGPAEGDRFLGTEIAGYLSGIIFYLSTRRSRVLR